MPPKLTLSVSEPLRTEAHAFAKKEGISISRLVSEYFSSLTSGTGALIVGKAADFAKFRKAATKAGLTLSEWLISKGKDGLK